MSNPAANFTLQGRRLQIAKRDTDGYPIGIADSDGAMPAADDAVLGEAYHALTVNGYVSRTAPVKEVEYATDVSDGTNKGKVPMAINDYGTGEIELSEEDENAINMVTGASTDTTLNTAWRITAGNDAKITSDSMIIMFTDRVKDQKTGNLRYKNTIYHNATITITTPAGASQSGGVNPNNMTWSYDVAPSDRVSVMGYLFSATDLDVEEDNDTYTIIWSDNPLSFTTYMGDGTSGTWNTMYKPLYNTVTGASRNTITKEGALYPVTSFSTTTALVTPTGSVTSGHHVIVLYETAYREP
jgi:hypothetical protein